MDQVRLATVWLGGCSGCHMSFLDLDERLIDLAERVQLVYSPIADAKVFPEADVTLVEGAVTNAEHVEQIHEIRRKTRHLIAFGDCAVTGNVTAIRNLYPVDELLRRSYVDTASIVNGSGPPGTEPPVPALLDRAWPLHELVTVDAYLPGCPPSAKRIQECLSALLDGKPRAALSGGRFG